MSGQMTMTQMNYFITVAKCLCISEASKKLFITQPALSRQVLKIEHELNMLLFIRGPKELRLTPAGATLLNELPKVLEAYHQAVEKAEESSFAFSGSLCIGIIEDHDVSGIFPDVLEHIRREHPNIKIILERLTFSQLLNRMYESKLDIAITYEFDVIGKEGLLYKPIQKVTPCLAIPNNNPISQKADCTIADLKKEQFIIVNREDCELGVELIISACQHYGGFYPNFCFADTMENVILSVECGMGIALLNDKSKIMNSPFVTCRKLTELPQMNVVMAWNKRNTNPAIPILHKYI